MTKRKVQFRSKLIIPESTLCVCVCVLFIVAEKMSLCFFIIDNNTTSISITLINQPAEPPEAYYLQLLGGGLVTKIPDTSSLSRPHYMGAWLSRKI